MSEWLKRLGEATAGSRCALRRTCSSRVDELLKATSPS